METKKKKNFFKYTLFIIFLIIGASAGYFIGKLGGALSVPKNTVIYVTAFFIPIFIFVVGVHELGHAIAGVLVKFDFRTYVVGPFLWNKETSGWKFKWNTNINTMGGLVICLPTSQTSNINKSFAWYAAGGPIASLTLAIIAFTATYFLHVLTDLISLKFLLATLGFLSFIIMATTVIPYNVSGLASDGARIISMLQGGDKAKFEGLILKLLAYATSGVRPKLIPLTDLDEAKILGDKLQAPFRIYIPSFYHQMAFDNNDLVEAEKHLLEHVSFINEMPKGINGSVWIDAAFFYAFAKKDLAKATEYFSKFSPSAMTQKAQVLATEASLAFLKEDYQLALIKIENANQELVNMIDKGLAIALREKLTTLKATISLAT